jgi:hypothetical protein
VKANGLIADRSKLNEHRAWAKGKESGDRSQETENGIQETEVRRQEGQGEEAPR